MKSSFLAVLACVSFLISCRHRPADLHAKDGRQAQQEISIPPLSEGCTEADFARFGRPIMLEARKGVFYGVSVTPEPSFQSRLYFWIENRSDEVQVVSSCTDTDWLKDYGFNVYDASGHRLRSIEEEKHHESNSIVCGMTCESTASALVLPHACLAPDLLGSRDLLDIYSLQPGQYTLRMADISACKIDPETGEPKPSLTGENEKPALSLTIRIDSR